MFNKKNHAQNKNVIIRNITSKKHLSMISCLKHSLNRLNNRGRTSSVMSYLTKFWWILQVDWPTSVDLTAFCMKAGTHRAPQFAPRSISVQLRKKINWSQSKFFCYFILFLYFAKKTQHKCPAIIISFLKGHSHGAIFSECDCVFIHRME